MTQHARSTAALLSPARPVSQFLTCTGPSRHSTLPGRPKSGTLLEASAGLTPRATCSAHPPKVRAHGSIQKSTHWCAHTHTYALTHKHAHTCTHVHSHKRSTPTHTLSKHRLGQCTAGHFPNLRRSSPVSVTIATSRHHLHYYLLGMFLQTGQFHTYTHFLFKKGS